MSDPVGLAAELSVRAARPAELPEIGRLTVAAYVADGHISDGHPYAETLADAAGRARAAELLVAVDDGDRVVGTVTVCPAGSPYAEISGPGELEVRMLAVHPRARGRGAGRALMAAVVRLATARGCRRLVLCSAAGMGSAQRIYSAIGFRRAPERDRTIAERIVLLAFVLDLRPSV